MAFLQQFRKIANCENVELNYVILKEYRASIEFTNGGGSRKLTHYLTIEKQLYINHKKIYRLCDENNLLLFKHGVKNKRVFVKSRCSYSNVSSPNQLWQFDLKHIWIHAENRWCFFLGFIDVFTKKITGWYVWKTCKAGDLVFALNQSLQKDNISSDSSLVIRSDKGNAYLLQQCCLHSSIKMT